MKIRISERNNVCAKSSAIMPGKIEMIRDVIIDLDNA
jgi:hypothetical protein